MFVTNLDDVRPLLRTKLKEYLAIKLDIDPNAKKINCFVHKDSNPSMHFNPKTNNETVVCFACGAKADIFKAAAILDNMPESGPEWVTETIPYLAKLLDVPISVGQPSAKEKEKLELYKLCQDIADILSLNNGNKEYIEKRNWYTNDIIIGSINQNNLLTELQKIGHDSYQMLSSGLLGNATHPFFGEDKVTFVIKDYRSRAIGFITRNLNGEAPKYINSYESAIYEKRKALLGIDVALKKGQAKQQGVYIVEGPGDLTQLYRLGIYNAVAVCGTALTKHHLELLKILNINTITLALDWDSAGVLSTQRILKEEMNDISGLSIKVLLAPNTETKDIDQLLSQEKTPEKFLALKSLSSFEWLLTNVSKNKNPIEIAEELIPSIAIETSAIKRELLCKTLNQYTGLSVQSILEDVDRIRSGKENQKQKKIKESVERYLREVQEDPSNISSLKLQHEEELSLIEKDFAKDIIGVNHQLARFDAMQLKHKQKMEGTRSSGFRMNHFKIFEKSFSDGMDLSSGVLMYLGGRANSGKTATGVALCIDVALSDPDAIVIAHFTDDGYVQIEPRVKATIAFMMKMGSYPVGLFANPKEHCKSENQWQVFLKATEIFRDLISKEKLIIIDSEDGKSISTLEANIRYIRQRHPDKKILVFSDSTYNYNSFEHLDQRQRIARISDAQKAIATRYDCCVMATAEYRKNMPQDHSKLKLPVDDDLADARELQYRASIIIHVYNDVHDRRDDAEIFWGDKQPRLLLVTTKNKIGKWKNNLIMDLDVNSVTLKEVSWKVANEDWKAYVSENEVENNTYQTETEYEDD